MTNTLTTRIHETTQQQVQSPIRDLAMSLEHWGANYHATTAILQAHLAAAAEEIAAHAD